MGDSGGKQNPAGLVVGWITIAGIVALVLYVRNGIKNDGPRERTSVSLKDLETTSGARGDGTSNRVDVFDRMVVAFRGGYSYDEIRRQMIRVVDSYGLPRTDKSYSSCASAMIVMRKQHRVKEMDIAAEVIAMRLRGALYPVADAIAIAAVNLSGR